MISNANPNTINPGPVRRAGLARSITAAQTTLPSMRGTVLGWFKPMTVGVVEEKIAAGGDRDGQSVSTVREVRTSGVILPDDEELEIKKEGQRTWARSILYVFPQLNVLTDTRVIIAGQAHRIMGKKNFTVAGYIRYKLMEDYDNV